MKVKNDPRSKFPKLGNWKEEAWKNQVFNGTRDLREAVEALIFSGFLFQLLKLEIYCDDHSSLSFTAAVQIWIISYLENSPKKVRGLIG